ncbi:Zn-ribbon domain-containing OB-fold protein [Pseudonocardia sp. WMMC193]|uniref:Zn-ribbon domain-containing OB-fold protein n=1 Tax=Pseudonocardia sp. WMMC193 TaxID=2911965 RepID=UPI001F21EFCF|nr:OB-fold domain-containing protein [Pseudonocardia sp. WMMC193]MCF7553309.1 OB-fold domain-containing protein [Pseudonocardia sp. WMMC193]
MAAAYGVRLIEDAVEGSSCPRCGYACAPAIPRCPACGGTAVAARFDPTGRVWSATDVALSVAAFGPGTLSYVDLDGGPRVLVRGTRPPAAPGTRVRLVASESGMEVEPCR